MATTARRQSGDADGGGHGSSTSDWGRHVRAALVLADRTIEWAASQMNLSAKTLQRTIRGERQPRVWETRRLAELLEVPSDFIERGIQGLSGTSQATPSRTAVPPASSRLGMQGALLSRTDLRELGLPRRAIDVVFSHCPVIVLPGFARPFIRAEDYDAFTAQHTFKNDRVMPSRFRP